MSIAETMEKRARQFVDRYTAVREQIGRVIVGHDEIVHGVLTCLFVGGHCLLEGVPGLGKTLLVRTLAKTLDLRLLAHPVHARPDAGRHPRHEHGHGNARRQAVLRVPAGADLHPDLPGRRNQPRHAQDAVGHARNDAGRHGHRRPARAIELKQPFFVMATQNPIEQEGTYPLPEAQLDRFFFKLLVGYSSREELATIIDRTTRGEAIEPAKVMDGARDPRSGSSWSAR